MLKQSLIDLEEITEKKIEEFQREQEMLLVREKEKATYDSAILWQRMKEIAKTVQEEDQRVRRLAYQKTKNGVTDQILFNRIISEEEQNQTIRDTVLDATEIEMRKHESHVHFSHGDSYESAPETEHRRRSSAFKRDLFGGFGAPAHQFQKSTSFGACTRNATIPPQTLVFSTAIVFSAAIVSAPSSSQLTSLGCG